MEVCVHLYEGDGKGKTTAAMGLALRAFGCGQKVVITQFLKGLPSGEIEPLRGLGIPVYRTEEVKKFVFQMTPEEFSQTKQDCMALLEKAKQVVLEGIELLIMDEIIDAVNCELVNVTDVLELLNTAKGRCEVVMTGRNPKQELIEAADYYTKMSAIKHPYQKGILSRKGIEF